MAFHRLACLYALFAVLVCCIQAVSAAGVSLPTITEQDSQDARKRLGIPLRRMPSVKLESKLENKPTHSRSASVSKLRIPEIQSTRRSASLTGSPPRTRFQGKRVETPTAPLKSLVPSYPAKRVQTPPPSTSLKVPKKAFLTPIPNVKIPNRLSKETIETPKALLRTNPRAATTLQEQIPTGRASSAPRTRPSVTSSEAPKARPSNLRTPTIREQIPGRRANSAPRARPIIASSRLPTPRIRSSVPPVHAGKRKLLDSFLPKSQRDESRKRIGIADLTPMERAFWESLDFTPANLRSESVLKRPMLRSNDRSSTVGTPGPVSQKVEVKNSRGPSSSVSPADRSSAPQTKPEKQVARALVQTKTEKQMEGRTAAVGSSKINVPETGDDSVFLSEFDSAVNKEWDLVDKEWIEEPMMNKKEKEESKETGDDSVFLSEFDNAVNKEWDLVDKEWIDGGVEPMMNKKEKEESKETGDDSVFLSKFSEMVDKEFEQVDKEWIEGGAEPEDTMMDVDVEKAEEGRQILTQRTAEEIAKVRACLNNPDFGRRKFVDRICEVNGEGVDRKKRRM